MGSDVQYPAMIPTKQSVQVRVKGRWVTIPGIKVHGDLLIATGSKLKIAKIRGEEMREDAVEDPELYLSALRNDRDHSLKADIFTFTQKLPEIERRFPYPMEWESVAAITLSSFKEWWEGLPQESRKNVRRSQKRGVEIAIKELNDAVVQGIREVNDDSPMRQGVKNAYYGLSAEETWERYGEFPGRCDFICAFAEQKMIGFLHLVYRKNVAAVLNLVVKPSELDKRPANALMAKAVEVCESRGITHLSYGLYNYGNKRDSSLREFKIRNGFTEILVPRYFVPLTMWGRIAMKANLHKGLIGILPPSVISTGLRVRSMWYKKFRKPV